MNDRVELLAPAGDWDSFLAAVENGADAVYLGSKLFNARQFAGNFDHKQLREAVAYAHTRDVKVYLALNTLISDAELEQAVDCTGQAYMSGIDGIIVQDIGLAGLIKNIFPDLDLHASTQMTVYNLEGVKVLEQLGFKRAVLARELSLEEIAAIAKNSDMEIEVFVHGALCISYSGQCLMSSIIGGRSGNRGKCAQPCRLPYQLVQDDRDVGKGRGKYLLSPKDLCSLEIIDQLLKTGITSLKIEGRMKSPEYVATVVGTYRKYIDKYLERPAESGNNFGVNPEDMKNLTQIFNRGGFSKGYLQGKHGRDMMCCEKPKNWGIYLGEVISYDRAGSTVKIRLDEELSIGDGIEVWNEDDEHPGTVVTEIKVNGKSVPSAEKGQIVTASAIRGKIGRGNKVYKTSDKHLLAAARETFEGRLKRRTAVNGEITLREGVPVTFMVSDPLGNEVRIDSGLMPEKAINRPLTVEKVMEQLRKTGATPFEFAHVDIHLDQGLSIAISTLNDIRRRALEELEQRRINAYLREMSDEQVKIKEHLLYFPGNSRNRSEQLKISLLFYTWDEKMVSQNLNVDRIYIPFQVFLDKDAGNALFPFREKGTEIYAWLPSITRGNYDKLIKSRLGGIEKKNLDGILVGNLGSVEYIKELQELSKAGDYTLNAFNSFSLKEMEALGLDTMTLSPELTLAQIKNLKNFDGIATEAIVYGRIPLMTSEYCPVGSVCGEFGAKSKCSEACKKGNYRLRDRMGMEFPVLSDRIDCRSTIFNSNILFVPDVAVKLKGSGVNMLRLQITDEKPEEIEEIVEIYRDAVLKSEAGLRKHEQAIGRIRDKGFTKGHFFRGV